MKLHHLLIIAGKCLLSLLLFILSIGTFYGIFYINDILWEKNLDAGYLLWWSIPTEILICVAGLFISVILILVGIGIGISILEGLSEEQ